MSCPEKYVLKHSKRQKRFQQLVKKMVNECVEEKRRSTHKRGATSRYAATSRSMAEIVPKFDPDSKDSNVIAWLSKIDQLGVIHDWDDYEKCCYMQSRLAGEAKEWFNRLENYDLKWNEWKAALERVFPRLQDYAELLEELVKRKKMGNETMSHYYRAKLAMIHRCRLDDEAALSVIIKGLPVELQANARAYQCNDPADLYAGFLASLEHYQELSTSRTRDR